MGQVSSVQSLRSWIRVLRATSSLTADMTREAIFAVERRTRADSRTNKLEHEGMKREMFQL